MADGLGQWVVRDRDRSGFRDGLSGEMMRYDGTRFVSDLGADATAPRMDRPSHVGGVQLQVETVHQAAEGLELGASTAATWRALTGSDPLGWGLAEPASQLWSQRELTSLARSRAPRADQHGRGGRQAGEVGAGQSSRISSKPPSSDGLTKCDLLGQRRALSCPAERSSVGLC